MGHNIQTMEVVKENGTIELYASVSSRSRRTVLNKGDKPIRLGFITPSKHLRTYGR